MADGLFFILIMDTASAPTTREIPDSKIIAGIDEPSAGNNAKLIHEAMICGKQILPLNKPKYIPIFSPDNAFVSIVNGNVIIAAHAIPIRMKETTNKAWL